jgi:hypothetical protein
MYHDRTAWRCAFFVGKKYGSKGYPQGNSAHMGSVSLWISNRICNLLIELPTYYPGICFMSLKETFEKCAAQISARHQQSQDILLFRK